MEGFSHSGNREVLIAMEAGALFFENHKDRLAVHERRSAGDLGLDRRCAQVVPTLLKGPEQGLRCEVPRRKWR
jgi:hypothetical protein